MTSRQVRGLPEPPREGKVNYSMDAEEEAVFSAAVLLAVSIQRVAGELTESATKPKRRTEILSQLRTLIHADRGIPKPDKRGYEPAIGRHLHHWIEQARQEKRDARWLKRACTAVDGRFSKIPLAAFQSAIDPPKKKQGPVPTLQPAVDLAKLAGIIIHLGTLQNLKVRKP